MRSPFERLLEIVPEATIESRWSGHGEPKDWIEAPGMIEGTGESEAQAVRDFMWRNQLSFDDE